MKIAFVAPPFDNGNSWGSKRRIKYGMLAPLGVGYLAAYLKTRGHASTFIDAAAEELDIRQTVEAIARQQPDAVGIACLTLSTEPSTIFAEAVKRVLPHVLVIIGGPQATSYWRELLKECPYLDLVVPGEGEIPLANLMDCLATGQSYHHVRGLAFRDSSGEPILTEPEPPVMDLDRFPPPDRSLFRRDLYTPLPDQGRKSPIASVVSSRGCPWSRCTFCYYAGAFTRPYRRRSPGDVVREIYSLIHEHGYREIIFWDDNFCFDEPWIEEFCRLLEKERLDIPWTAEGHARTVTRSMLQRMAAAGCYNIFYGIESGNELILRLVQKGTTLQMYRDAVAWAKQAGMEIRCAYMLGFPTETPQMARQTIQFACELNVDYAAFIPFHIWPGTAITDLAMKEGRCLPWNGNLFSPSYLPNAFSSPAELAGLIRAANWRYYIRPSYMAKSIWRLKNPREIKKFLLGFRHWLDFLAASHV